MDKVQAPITADICLHHRLWGSVRLTYTICAFLAMVVQLCLRNTLNFVILCMVKHNPEDNGTIDKYEHEKSRCGALEDFNSTNLMEEIHFLGELAWTRNQEFALLGTFYYGYLVTLPIAGRLADRFGGKLLFIHSITVQAVVFMMMPFFARKSFTAAVVVRVLQGLISGCGNPTLYQLFSTWAHPTERTALLSFAYGGYAVGSLLVFPISSFMCQFGWDVAFYSIGGVSLLFGLSCHWFVYSSLEEHPRLSQKEYEYLKAANVAKTTCEVPWLSILKSKPIYAFVFTHIFHTYGLMVFTLLIPRFFNEALQLPLDKVGLLSSAPFLGSFISKAITIASCSRIEKHSGANLSLFRRMLYVICNCVTIGFTFGIIFFDCQQSVLVVLFTLCVGVSTDLSFSGAYWPSLLFMAPSYAGLITGIANCLATASGFLAPLGISTLVKNGSKTEWDHVMYTLIISYSLGAIAYGCFGSSELQHWNHLPERNNIEMET